MGKAAAFVCAVVLGIVLVTSADTESSSTTESTLIEENVSQNIPVNKSEEEIKYPYNDNSEETNEREISSQNSQKKGDVGEGDETESSSNSNSEGTTTKRPRNRKGARRSEKKGKGSNIATNSNDSGRAQDEEDVEQDTPVCSSPPDIEGAITPQLRGTEHPVGTTVTYNCPYGYVSRNSINHVSVCDINPTTGRLEWRAPEITCIPRSCGDPGHVSNGRRIGNLFTFPNKIEYVCDEGYKVRGLSVRYCQAGGDWSGGLPTCNQIYCKVPADPPNGRVRYSSLEYGTELRYECNVGFLLKKHQPRICSEDGSWSNEEPQCIEATCEEPEAPKFGTVKLHGALTVGSLATYSCDPDRKLYGATTTKCLISGQWTFDAPECLRSCKVPFIENGELGTYEIRYSRTGSYFAFTKVPVRQYVESQKTLALHCKNGYKPVENPDVILSSNRVEVTCSDGSWSRDLQCKRTSCQGHPPPSKNAQPVIKSRAHGHTIYYVCTSKYTEKIPGKVTCHFGSWIGITPKCLNQPCYTRNLDYPGLVKPPEEHFDSSESFEINCERGYRTTAGIRTISCVKGRWEISRNPCTSEREESGIIPPTRELQISRGGENQPGTNVESYSPRTTETTRNPECFCSYNYKDPHVKMQTIHKTLAERDVVKLGETVSLECDSPSHRLKWDNGLIFYGKAYMTCSICRQWLIQDLPTCTRASSNAFIKHDGDFKILPGGIIDIQRRENREYECRSYYSAPIWDFHRRQNVRTETGYQVVENERTYYVTHLHILEASDQHNGQYECFLRGEHGSRVGSTYFNLQVHDGEDRSTTAEPGVLIGGKVTRPSVNVETSTHHTWDAQLTEDCFCTYEYEDSYVKAQTEQKTLKLGDTIRRGERVSFECKYANMALKWRNGLRLTGKANLICSECKKWHWNEVPICEIYEKRNVVITVNDDLNILPGGTAIVKKRERNIFYCISSFTYPAWNYGQRRGVSVTESVRSVSGIPYYVSVLDIGKEENDPTGEYECYVIDEHGERTGSAFLHLQAYDGEDRRTTAEPGVLIGGKVTQPSVNVETHQTSDAQLTEDCFCLYEYEDSYVKAQTEQKTLKVGDTIRRGERVTFECKYVSMALKWRNGLRLTGKANLICSECKKWYWNEVPICENYEKRDVVITVNDDLNILPGGTAIVKKGERNTFYCISSLTYPAWNYVQRRGVSVTESVTYLSGIPSYVSVLDIGKEENDPTGEYECYVMNEYGERTGSAFLHLQAYETDSLCPPIDKSGIFTLRYSNNRRINSTVTFHCKEDGKRVEGRNCLTCLPDGTWSGKIPKCVDYISCPEFTLTPGLNVTYSKDSTVGSVASFQCSLPTKDLNGSSSSICQENGRWSNPLPSCEDQTCSIHDLGVSVPEGVELDMSTVTEEYVIIGFEVKLKCADRSVLTGDSKAVCEKQGKWKLGSFQCVPGCVLNLDTSSHLLVEPKKEGYRIGERITLSCPPGEELSSDVEQLMCLSGLWSDSLPICIELEKKPSL